MSFPYNKQPAEIERVGADFNNRLPSGDEVISATYVVVDSDGTDVTATLTVSSSEQISDTDGDGTNDTATIEVQAGIDGNSYKLTIEATTTNGLVLEEDIIIKVRSR